MPRHQTVTVTGDGWTQLTDANVTEITFQNISSMAVFVSGTNGATAPTDAGGLVYMPYQGEAKVALADLFPGVTGANRVWAKSSNGQVFVSHA